MQEPERESNRDSNQFTEIYNHFIYKLTATTTTKFIIDLLTNAANNEDNMTSSYKTLDMTLKQGDILSKQDEGNSKRSSLQSKHRRRGT